MSNCVAGAFGQHTVSVSLHYHLLHDIGIELTLHQTQPLAKGEIQFLEGGGTIFFVGGTIFLCILYSIVSKF